MTARYLVRGRHVLTSSQARTPAHVPDGAVLVEGERITRVGPYAAIRGEFPDVVVHGGPHDIVTPGFVNTHGHFSEGLITGIADGHTLWEWVHALIRPVGPHLDRAMAYSGTVLAGIQMIHSGITTANDMFCSMPGRDSPITPGVVDALDDLCLRGVVSYGAGDLGNGTTVAAELDEHEALREAAEASPLSVFRVGVGAIGSQSDEMLARTVELATRSGAGVHIHLQEIREEVTATFERFGAGPIATCAREGLFAVPTLAAHCVWADQHDRELLAEHVVGVAHNPVSNMILASGVAPVTEMRRLGVDVGIGVDGAASNDGQNMLEAIKATSLLARVHHLQASVISTAEAFAMATIDGARALRMDDEIGSLEPGKAADIVRFDGNSPALANVHDPYQAIVHVAGQRDVADVWCAGRQVLAAGEVTTVDVADQVARSRPLARELVAKAGLGALSELS